MNLVLFEPSERNRPIGRSDPRVRHIADILKCGEGDTFEAGEINGKRGKATVRFFHDESVEFQWDFDTTPAPLRPITLIAGLPRPQSARDILRDATSLGVERIFFVSTEKGERSYAESKLWHTGEYRKHLIAGAEMAFSTFLPEVLVLPSLKSAIDLLSKGSLRRIALDNYEATVDMTTLLCEQQRPHSAVLAVGAERGWAESERHLFRNSGFTLASLGERVLRAETAVIAGIALLGTFSSATPDEKRP